MWKAVTNPGRTCWGITIASLDGLKGSDFLTTSRPSLAIVTLLRYLFTLGIVVSFFDGQVPCISCALTLRRSGHSDWVSIHAFLLVNGSWTFPFLTSTIDILLTTLASNLVVKRQTWHLSETHCTGFRDPKSDGALASPERWSLEIWYLLTVFRKVDRRALLLNSPLLSKL